MLYRSCAVAGYLKTVEEFTAARTAGTTIGEFKCGLDDSSESDEYQLSEGLLSW